MDEIFIPIKNEQEVKLMNPLVWAYVGDCIYELYIRTFLVNTTKMKVHELHVKASTFVKASSQAESLKKIENELTEEEKLETHKIIIYLKMRILQIICMQLPLKV